MSSSVYPRISRENNFDVVRLFAALQVCTGHIFEHFNTSGGIISKFLSFFPGVIIFFAISGFLITSSWCHSKSYKQFAKNRFLRIFPALFVCFIVLQLVMVVFGHINWSSFGDFQMWLYWIGQLSLGQFFTADSLRDFGVGAPNGSLWTIPIEIEFYILIPLVFIFLLHISVKWKLMILGGLSIIANIIIHSLRDSSLTHTNALELIHSGNFTLIIKLLGVTVVPYLYCFILGALLFIAWDKIKKYFINKAFYWLGIYFTVMIVSESGPSYGINNMWNVICNLLLGCVAISSAFSFGKIYRYLQGMDISYGVYIIHMIIVNVFIELGYGYNVQHSILALIITIILAILLFMYIEKPTLSLKNKRIFK